METLNILYDHQLVVATHHMKPSTDAPFSLSKYQKYLVKVFQKFHVHLKYKVPIKKISTA